MVVPRNQRNAAVAVPVLHSRVVSATSKSSIGPKWYFATALNQGIQSSGLTVGMQDRQKRRARAGLVLGLDRLC